MQYKQITYLLALVYLILYTMGVKAQSSHADTYFETPLEVQHFDVTTWKENTKDLAYPTNPNLKQQDGNGQEKVQSDMPDMPSFSIPPIIAKVIMYSGIAIALFFLIYAVLNNQLPKDKKVINLDTTNSATVIEHIEENIHESDIDHFISQAINQAQYSVAIRLYYLNILKEMSVRKMIKWKKDKTNQAYIQEINDNNYQRQLKALTFSFEKVWYGEITLTKELFERIVSPFEDLLLTIKQLPNEEL